MDEFLKDRMIEKETCAIINFFKLVKQAETSENDTYDNKYLPEVTFELIGGMDSFNRLLIDCKEGNINVFSNSMGSLFKKLEDNIDYLSSITISKSIITEEAIQKFNLIKKFYSDVYSITGSKDIAAIYDLVVLPLPKNMISQILEIKPKEKKLGER